MPSTRYSDATLDELRRQGDASADRLVAEIREAGEREHVAALLHTLLRNDQVVPADLSEDVRRWLNDNDSLPPDLDLERVDRAAEHFAHHAFSYAVVLATSSLLEAYAARTGVEVLTFSHRLDYDVRRRIAETSQFYLTVQSPGAYGPDGGAVPALLKIRLMHASVRSLILESGRWDAEAKGVPICQEDLLGTLLTFSALLVRDLPKLGTPISDDQGEDLLYYWRVAGPILGIDAQMIPRNLEEAAELGQRIAARHHARSEAGARMARTLLDFHRSVMPTHLFDSMVPAFLRAMVGDELCDLLDIPESKRAGMFTDHEHMIHEFTRPLELLGKSLLAGAALALNGGHRAEFDIPPSLEGHLRRKHGAWREAVSELAAYSHRHV